MQIADLALDDDGRCLAVAGWRLMATVLVLDSGVQRYDAHRSSLRERMAVRSHHVTKRLTDECR